MKSKMGLKVGVGATALALVLALVVLGSPRSASATTATISGRLWLVSSTVAGNAVPANIPATTPDVTFDVNSPIDFAEYSSSTVGQWLSSGGAFNVVENTPGALSSSVNTGTLVAFGGVVSVTNGETFTVTHDDGLTLIIGSTNLGFSAGPTAPITSTATYTGPTGIFGFQLVYGELSGAPAVLQVDLPLATPTIALNPPSAVNPVGTNHTVTATVDDNNGNPAQGVTVDFSVTSGPNTGATGTCAVNADCTTDASGNVSWTYTGGTTAGIDTIQACVELTQTCTTAMKTWYDPNAGFVTGGGWVGAHANFGFVAKYQSGSTTPVGSVEYQDRDAGIKFHSNSFDANGLIVLGDTATVTGTGTLNGVSVTFTLTVTDNSPDTFEIAFSTGYDSGLQSLTGGNVQIHS